VPEAPYPSAHVLPARIEAEHFDAGGEGVSYHDFEPANLGNDQAARAGGGVDIETDAGVTDVCYVRSGEYLKYSVDTPVGGSLELTLRAANPDPATKTVRVSLDGAPAVEVPIAATGGWAAFQDFAATAPLTVPAGRHIVTLAFEGVDRVNLDWLNLGGAAPTATPTPTPTANTTETVTPTPTSTVNVTPTGNVTPTTTVPGIALVPGGAGLPTSTAGNGVYDDVNGNGRADFADVVLYFNQMSWIAANEPLAAFDYNGNGRIDFADVAWLFNHL
jgi:hypothetical protein